MNNKDKVIVILVWCLITYEVITYLYFYGGISWQHDFMQFVMVVPIWVVDVILLCWSYFKATFTAPGFPSFQRNLHYHESLDDLKNYARREAEQKRQRRKNRKPGQINLDEIKALNQVSYCFKCDVVKEERVHHCSICRRCIIRMDHHCPWVGNCVGRMNHKYFLLFLFYATVHISHMQCGLSTIAISITINYLTHQEWKLLTQWETLFVGMTCISSYMLAASIGFLFVTQMMTSCRNITTLESFTAGVYEHNVWNKGSFVENLREIFGEGVWLLPTAPFPYHQESPGSSFDMVSL